MSSKKKLIIQVLNPKSAMKCNEDNEVALYYSKICHDYYFSGN